MIIPRYDLKTVGVAELLAVRVHLSDRHGFQLCRLTFLKSVVAERGTNVDPPGRERKTIFYKKNHVRGYSTYFFSCNILCQNVCRNIIASPLYGKKKFSILQWHIMTTT